MHDKKGNLFAHSCLASRKDFRDAVGAARKAQPGWAARSAYNRGQILYRMAEMLEGKRSEFQDILALESGSRKKAEKETEASIDRLVNYAGWCDKYAQVLGCNNPVAGPYYNFTIPEACGVVTAVAPDRQPLLGIISMIAPALCAGNTVVGFGSERNPLAVSVLGEVCGTSDVPAGVINLLTGNRSDLLPIAAEHRDVDAIHGIVESQEERLTLELGTANNMKRVRLHDSDINLLDDGQCQSPYWISELSEMKTIWHPTGD